MHVETKTNVLLLFWTFLVTRRKNRDNDVPSTRHGLCVRQECSLNTTRLVFQTWVFPQHDTACVSDMSVPSTRHGLCVRHECDLCHLFYILILYQLLSNQWNQRMEFIVILFRLKLVKKFVFARKRDYENVRECTSYSTTECHCIMFDIDQDVILTW
jgi:hypothetical protein